MTDASFDPNANPFDTVGFVSDAPPSSSTTDTSSDAPPLTVRVGRQTSAPSLPAAPAAGTDPSASTSNPFDAVGFVSDQKPAAPTSSTPVGTLSNDPNGDTNSGGLLKGTGTAIIKGLSDIPGIAGNLHDLAELGSDYLFAGAQTGIGHLLGDPTTFAQNMAKNDAARQAALDQQRKDLGGWVDYAKLPSGRDISQPVLNQTGEYVPTTEGGKIGMAGIESAVGGVIPGEGVAGTLTNAARTAVPNFIAGGAGQAATDATGNPLLGAAAGMGVLGTLHAVGSGASAAAGAFRDAVPPITASQKSIAARTIVGRELTQNATDPAAAATALQTQPAEIVPGSQGTVGQITADPGLANYEKGVLQSPEGKGPAEQLAQAQNRARVGMLDTVQPDGNVLDLPQGIRDRAAAVDQSTAAGLASAQADQQRAIDNLRNFQSDGSPQDTATHFRLLRDAIDANTQGAIDNANQSAATARSAIAPTAANAEAAGSALRGPAQQAYAARHDAEEALWRAVNPTGTMVMPGGSIADAAKGVMGDMTESATPMRGEEARVFDVASRYGDLVPFRAVTDLRSSISTAMAEAKDAGNLLANRRLIQLRGAVENAIDTAAEHHAAQDQAAVQAGYMAPEDTMAARLGAADAPRTGSAVFTPSGRRIDVNYRVVDAGDLTASHTADMRPNPNYPPELQPRDRTRAVSDAQVQAIASRLQPERLGASVSAAEGAPIVGPDGLVESGNGRLLAIQRAYAQGGPQARAYRDFLASQGHDLTGMQSPVLVRQRVTPMTAQERIAFAREANASPVLAQSATERAANDAKRMPDATLALHRGGDVGSAANRDFVRDFVRNVADRGEEGSIATRDGSLSTEGAQRIRNALLHAAYDDPRLVSSIAEHGGENFKAFGNVLNDVAGPVAQLRREVQAGRVDPSADLSRPLSEAAKVIQQARIKGQKIGDILAQQDAFSRVSGGAEALLKMAYGQKLEGRLNRAQLVEDLGHVVNSALQQSTEARLFGEAHGVSDPIHGVQARYGSGRQTSGGGGFGAQADFGGSREAGAQGRGPGGFAGRSGGQGTGRSGAQGAEILDRYVDAPRLDAEAAGRLKAASKATKDLKIDLETGPAGPILARDGRGNLDHSNAEVPRLVLHPGPTGGEDVRSYLRFVGPERGIPAVTDAAAVALRDYAIRPGDGTLDPAKIERFVQNHAAALAELPPDVRQRFSTAAGAERAVADALGDRRDQMSAFEKSEAGRFAGVGSNGDVVARVGSILDSHTNPVQRLGQLAQDARGNDAAAAGLKRAVVEHVLNRFAPEVGEPKVEALQNYLAAKRDVLGTVLSPDDLRTITERAADVSAAGQRLSNAAAERKAALSTYDKGLLGQIRSLRSGDDVVSTIRGVLGAKDGATRMEGLAREAAAVPGGTDALKRAVVESVRRDIVTSDIGQLDGKKLATFMANRMDALKAAGLSTTQIGKLRAVTDDAIRVNRAIALTRSRSGSDTSPNAQRAAVLNNAGNSIIGQIALESALTIAGEHLGGTLGALFGKTAGEKVLSGLREAGLDTVKKLRVEAVLNPELGLALIQAAKSAPKASGQAVLQLRKLQLAGQIANRAANAQKQ